MSAVDYSEIAEPVGTEPETESAPRGTAIGLFQAFHRFLATLLSIVHTRVELLTTELQEEVHRAAALILWALIALFAGLIGLIFGGLTVVFAYWDTNRVLAAVLVTVGFFAFTGIAILVLMAKIKSHKRLLDSTLTEISKDITTLRSRHS